MGVESTPAVSPANHITSETETKKKGKKKQPLQMYRGPGGAALPRAVVDNLTRFQQKQKEGRIDVWWLYDDGGLTILLPYILSQRSQYSSTSLRVFTLASSQGELGQEQRRSFFFFIFLTYLWSYSIHGMRSYRHIFSMAALLNKFRIDYSDVIVVTDIEKMAEPGIHQEFDALIEPFKEKPNETREPGIDEKTNLDCIYLIL